MYWFVWMGNPGLWCYHLSLFLDLKLCRPCILVLKVQLCLPLYWFHSLMESSLSRAEKAFSPGEKCLTQEPTKFTSLVTGRILRLLPLPIMESLSVWPVQLLCMLSRSLWVHLGLTSLQGTIHPVPSESLPVSLVPKLPPRKSLLLSNKCFCVAPSTALQIDRPLDAWPRHHMFISSCV